MNEFFIIYCYRKIWEEIRDLINTPRLTISLREVMLLQLRVPSHQARNLSQNPQRRLQATNPRRRRRKRMMIHIHHQLNLSAAAASAFAPPKTLLTQLAVVVSQSNVVPSLLVFSLFSLPPSCSFGITSCFWMSTSTGGIQLCALLPSCHCLLAPTLSSHGSSRIPEPQEFFCGPPSFLHWSLYHFCAPGKWSTSSICTRDQISIKDKVILTHTLTPRSTRKNTFSSCFSRALQWSFSSPTSCAPHLPIVKLATVQRKRKKSQLPRISQPVPPNLDPSLQHQGLREQ